MSRVPCQFDEAWPPSVEGAALRDERLWWLLELLVHAEGRADASDYRWSLINAFCNDREPTDTFNIAIDRGFTRSTHDSDSDTSTVYLTDAGRAYHGQFAAAAARG